MTDLTLNDLLDEARRIEERLNQHNRALVRERMKTKDLLEVKYEMTDTIELLQKLIGKLDNGIRMSAQSWSALDPV
jgi:hypothetical protein